MSALAPEDELRLNVMMAGEIQAVRIDEAALIVYGLIVARRSVYQIASDRPP